MQYSCEYCIKEANSCRKRSGFFLIQSISKDFDMHLSVCDEFVVATLDHNLLENIDIRTLLANLEDNADYTYYYLSFLSDKVQVVGTDEPRTIVT